ncbi:sensor domain-containing diguanylate cyclase, partial [Burkholderia sp. SIMBA_043]
DRAFTDEDSRNLQDLADLAATAIAPQARERADEIAWREEARKLSLAIAGSGTGVWDRNVVTGEITYSPGWKALLGYSESELTTRIE